MKIGVRREGVFVVGKFRDVDGFDSALADECLNGQLHYRDVVG